MVLRDIQQNITDIFNIITKNRDFNFIKYWFQNSQITDNEQALAARCNLHKRTDDIRKVLNDLSRITDELYATTEECKHFIELEKKKNPAFKTFYEKRSKKLVL